MKAQAELQEFANQAEIHAKADALAYKHIKVPPSGMSMLHLFRPMAFPVKTFGKAEIKTQALDCFDVVNFRYALLSGMRLKPLRVTFGKEMAFNLLCKEGNILTSDRPVEIHQQYMAFSKACGHVLVGGLGLGMCAEMMLRMPQVRSVTVVEKDEDVIGLVQPQISKHIKVVHADLYKYLKSSAEDPQGHPKFDFAYYDIWYRCGEGSWASNVVPLYRLSQSAGLRRLSAWGEWEMQAQLYPALFTRAMLPLEVTRWKPHRVFIEGCMKVLGEEPPFSDSVMQHVGALLDLYLRKVGTKKWEATFDWDAIP